MSWDVYLKPGRVFLHTKLWVPRDANGTGVVFSHGWGGAHVFDDLHQRLAGWGFTVASVEHRGYGQSTGHPRLSAWPKDMAAVAEWLRARGLRVWTMGLSTGGTIALVTAAKRKEIAGAVALSPFASLARILEDHPPCREILEARFGTLRPLDYRTADALRWGPKIRPRPAVVVHATGDEIVAFAHAEAIRERARGGIDLWRIEGGDHRLQTVERAPLFERIREFLLKVG